MRCPSLSTGNVWYPCLRFLGCSRVATGDGPTSGRVLIGDAGARQCGPDGRWPGIESPSTPTSIEEPRPPRSSDAGSRRSSGRRGKDDNGNPVEIEFTIEMNSTNPQQ